MQYKKWNTRNGVQEMEYKKWSTRYGNAQYVLSKYWKSYSRQQGKFWEQPNIYFQFVTSMASAI